MRTNSLPSKRSLWHKLPEPEEEDDLEDDSNLDDPDLTESERNTGFKQLVYEMVASGYAEKHPAESLLMEIKGLKFAQNKANERHSTSAIDSNLFFYQSFSDCISGIVPSILNIAATQSRNEDGSLKQGEFVKKLKELLQADGWGHKLLTNLIQGVTEDHPEATEESVI